MPIALRIMVATFLLIVIAAAGTLWWAARRWDAVTASMLAQLRAGAVVPKAASYSAAELDGLPPPVARYFRAALREGQPIVRRARIAWAGEFNLGKPGADRWVPFTATQEFVPGAPGMVWDARMAVAPGVTVRVRDSFIDGTGAMHGALLGLYTVVDVRGTGAIATAALQRYLGEAMWLPTALLPSQGVRWTPVDDRTARATLTGGATVASVEFRFDDDDRVQSVFVPDRSYDDGRSPPVPRPWQGRNLDFDTRHGMRVPGDAIVEWLFPEAPFAYWRARPLAVEYEYVADAPASAAIANQAGPERLPGAGVR